MLLDVAAACGCSCVRGCVCVVSCSCVVCLCVLTLMFPFMPPSRFTSLKAEIASLLAKPAILHTQQKSGGGGGMLSDRWHEDVAAFARCCACVLLRQLLVVARAVTCCYPVNALYAFKLSALYACLPTSTYNSPDQNLPAMNSSARTQRMTRASTHHGSAHIPHMDVHVHAHAHAHACCPAIICCYVCCAVCVLSSVRVAVTDTKFLQPDTDQADA